MNFLSSRSKRIFLISSYSINDENRVKRLIYELGGEVTELDDDFQATHLVIPFLRVTHKLIAALAAGLWIVQTSYVLESHYLRRWELEAKYEIGSKLCPYSLVSDHGYIPYQRKYEDAPRICREKALVRNRPNLSYWKVGLFMECQITLLQTKRILRAGGAVVLVLTLPIDVNIVKDIDFAVIKVKDLSSITPLMDIGIRCVPYNYVWDCLCIDPSPDISKYDCRRSGRREQCLIKEISGQAISSISSTKKEGPDRTLLTNSEENRNKAWKCYGKDNFKITLNSSGAFLMNTAISVTVDFNPQLMSEVEVKRIDSNVSEMKCLNSTIKAPQPIAMGEYYSQGTFTLQSKCSQSSCVENWSSCHHSEASDLNEISCSQTSPSKKRVLSPRNGMSPNKRRKSFTPQKNTIYNYFVRTDGIGIENTEGSPEVENISLHSNIDNSLSHRNTSRYCNSDGIVKNSPGKHCTMDTGVSEVVVISSDEDDLPINVAKKDEKIASWQTHLNSLDLYKEKPVSPENKGNKMRQKIFNSSNLSAPSIGPNKKNIHNEIYVVSSDEDDNCCFSSQIVIDLTDDDLCSADDAGGVIVPESNHFENDLMTKDYHNDDDDDDDCMSVISYQPGLLSQRKSISGDSDIVFLDELKTEARNCDFSASANQFAMKRSKSEESIKSEEGSEDSPLPPYISHQETESHLDDLCAKLAIMGSSEDNENISNSLLDIHDNNITDSTLHRPSQLFEYVVSRHDIPEERNEKMALSKESSKTENYERIDSEYLDHKGKQNSVCVKNRNCISETSLPSTKDSGTNILSSNEICEKGIEVEDTASSGEVDNEPLRKIIFPSAMRVCRVQAEVLLAKLYQPWIDLETDEVPQCCIMGPTMCNSLHGKKELCPEEAEYYDELLLLRMDCGTSAIDLLQSRLDYLVYPSIQVVQNLLFGCMNLWEEVKDVIGWLRQLLRLHPPCAFGMLDYYKRVLFNPVKNMRAPEGTFWFCVTKIEETMNAVEKQNTDNNAAVESYCDEHESSDFMEKFLECRDSSLSLEKEVLEIKPSDKLKQLFDTLDYLIRIMEADLSMGLLKNISNLKRYTCKTGRPLIAVALWGPHSNVGNVNTKCRYLMKMYLQIFESIRDSGYHRNFRRLISLMAGATYASDQNCEPPRYPNIESNCKDLANAFASIMMASALNMMEVRLILESLRPDWFRTCVCSNLLEKLYGRNIGLSLQPTVILLKSLNALNKDYPSEEEISKTFLAEQDTNDTARKDSEELSPNYVKQATKKDRKGETRLHIACRRNNIQEVERLLNVPSININEKDNEGWTPIHEAAFHGSVECVKRLLNFRTPAGGPAVDLQARSKGGITPLMDAVSKNHLEVASELLQCGGQKLLSDENNEGLSVWDHARTEEMKSVLLSAQDHGQEYDLLTIPRTLYVKLAVLTPLAILYYVKFSEVTRIVHYLKYNRELIREGASLVKFEPIAFKQDYVEFKKLQTFLKETLNNHNKLLGSLTSFA